MVVKINRRGQVTLFVIIAIVIVLAIMVVFFLGRYYSQKPEDLNPEAFIDKCARDAVSLSANKIFNNGGLANPELTIMYQDEKYNYLCYQKNYYWTCVNQLPALKQVIEKEIRNDTIQKIRQCFQTLKEDIESKGFSISEGELNYSIELVQKKILIKINKKFEISKEQSIQRFTKFDTQLLSPMYELSMVAREISNQESQYCNFEYNGFVLLYPGYEIKRISYDDSRIYKVKDRVSGKEFKFAVRSCAFPPGM